MSFLDRYAHAGVDVSTSGVQPFEAHVDALADVAALIEVLRTRAGGGIPVAHLGGALDSGLVVLAADDLIMLVALATRRRS